MAGPSDVGPVQWANQFPSGDGRFYEVLSPKSTTPIICVVTSERWLGVYTHHFDDRTRPCTGNELDCDGCHRRLGRRWKAYLCGAMPLGNRPVIIELTHGAVQSCPVMIPPTFNMRGMKIRLWRTKPGKQSQVRCSLEGIAGDYTVPPAFNLVRALHKVWGLAYDEDSEDGLFPGLTVPA